MIYVITRSHVVLHGDGLNVMRHIFVVHLDLREAREQALHHRRSGPSRGHDEERFGFGGHSFVAVRELRVRLARTSPGRTL